jgi:transcriptional regulator of acetoin/glycerol metabolism
LRGEHAPAMPTETDRELRSSLPRVWAPPEPHLFVVLEGDRPTAGGVRCSLRGIEEVALARGEARIVHREAASPRITIGLPDRKVSGHHARIVRSQNGWRVIDGGSTNGTFLNGAQVDDRLLSDADIIEVGRTVLSLRLALATPEGTPGISVGEDDEIAGLGTLLPALRAELAVMERIASSTVPVLLLGETGTGKEVVARAIHTISQRPGEFVAINCAALPETLIEALLFGHAKGAFSGAVREETGVVRKAHMGSLFLDEIGDLPRAAQAVLLRVLQEGEVVPVGSTRPIPVDLRVVAATHQPIEAMVEQGRFRRDLFARLQGFTHRLWPLAQRREDVGLLVAELLNRLAKERADRVRISVDAARALLRYEWPLNVRELAQSLSRGLTLADDGLIDVSHLPPALTTAATRRPALAEPPASLSAEQAVVRAELVANLERCRGNVAAVARHMKRAPMQIYRWMQRLGIDPRVFR